MSILDGFFSAKSDIEQSKIISYLIEEIEKLKEEVKRLKNNGSTRIKLR